MAFKHMIKSIRRPENALRTLTIFQPCHSDTTLVIKFHVAERQYEKRNKLVTNK